MCGGGRAATDAWQQVVSPSYPTEPYPADARCRWTLEAPENEHVLVQITDLDLQLSANCERDYLQLIDAPLVSTKSC